MSLEAVKGSGAAAAGHWVAVIGGATAGAEVAAHLADKQVNVVVFDQNPRPYGKIEDGLPRWHEALRKKEYHLIDDKLTRPRVHYVPLCKIGRDVDFDDLTDRWGFSVVVLACGAWRDRTLPLPEAARFVGKGLVYQNPFVVAFNHAEAPGQPGPPLADGALVIGGGLAAIDVAKILMLETTRRALALQGVDAPLVELEHKGIPAFLTAHGLQFADLGLRACTIVYRRREEDMPLVEIQDGADAAQIDKIQKTRLRILHHAQEKFLFRVQPLALAEAILPDEDGHVRALRVRRAKAKDHDTLTPTDDLFDMPTTLIVSAIGSVPEPIKGVPLRGELFDFSDWHLGRLASHSNVFSVGNVVTGRGNIAASRKHAREISESAVAAFLGLNADRAAESEVAFQLSAPARSQAQNVAHAVAIQLATQVPPASSTLLTRVHALQARVGYTGDYAAWIAAHPPRA